MEYVIANAGTEPTSLIDWENNLKQPFGKSEDMKNSLAFVEEFMKNNPSINVTFVGHSKGGLKQLQMRYLQIGMQYYLILLQ